MPLVVELVGADGSLVDRAVRGSDGVVACGV
jgi:hypothetical protein